MDALDDPHEGFTGGALLAARTSTARRRQTTLLMMVTQYIHVYQKLQFQAGELPSKELGHMEADLAERWRKVMEDVKKIVASHTDHLPAAVALRVKAPAAPGVGLPTLAAKGQ